MEGIATQRARHRRSPAPTSAQRSRQHNAQPTSSNPPQSAGTPQQNGEEAGQVGRGRASAKAPAHTERPDGATSPEAPPSPEDPWQKAKSSAERLERTRRPRVRPRTRAP
eukprot:9281175-Alexandrium_andersonii.AAC.1